MTPAFATLGAAAGGITFQSLGDSLHRIPDLLRTIPDMLRNPAANPLQAAILFLMLLIVALMVLLTVVLSVMRRGEGGVRAMAPLGGPIGSGPPAPLKPRAPRWQRVLTAGAVVVIVLSAVWVAAGVSTSSAQTCSSCHSDSPHASTEAEDPHAGVACVACHESGGRLSRATIGLLPRLIHIAQGRSTEASANGYGLPVSSDACVACHASQIAGVYVDRANGVSVSHKEPLAAGAACVDCHKLQSGVLSIRTVGMTSCLRCHNGSQAKAECPTCHAGDPARAISVALPTNNAAKRILVPNCGSCHTDQSTCDRCHGIRLPHTPQFEQYGHALQGARAIWTANGAPCSKCHYPGHNDCTQCHTKFPQHGLSWKDAHKTASWSGSSSGCSCHHWNQLTTGINFCQICHATKPATAKP